MQAFFNFTMKSRVHAAACISIFAYFSMVLPLLVLVTMALIALILLRQNNSEAMFVLGMTTVMFGSLTWWSWGSFWIGIEFIVVLSLIMAVLVTVLKLTRSLGMMLTATVVLACIAVALFYLVLDDPSVWWQSRTQQVMELMLQAAAQQDGAAPNLSEDESKNVAVFMQQMAGKMTFFFGFGVVVFTMCALILARWGQSLLDSPGSFAADIQAMKVPQIVIMVTLLIIVARFFVSGQPAQLLGDLFGPLLAMFTLLGIVIAHAAVNHFKLSTIWLVALYMGLILPFFSFFFIPLLAVTGIIDNRIDFRRRWKNKNIQSNI